jgi:two-component system response regulator MprA
LLRTAAGRLRPAFERGAGRRWPGPRSVLRYADLTLDPRSRLVRRAGRPIELTRTEFDLLELFLRHPGEVLTRSAIFKAVWGFDFGSHSNSLTVYVGYLRRKLEADGRPRLLQTVRGVGYVLRS